MSAWIDGASAPMERALDRLSPDERALDRRSPDERASFVRAMTFLEAELPADSDAVQRKQL